VENRSVRAVGALSDRHGAGYLSRTVSHPAGPGGVDADQQRSERLHPPVGGDSGAQPRASSLAPCQRTKTTCFFPRRPAGDPCHAGWHGDLVAPAEGISALAYFLEYSDQSV